MVSVLVICKALTEIALMLLLGQLALALLAGSRRQENFVYRVFEMATRPVIQATRWITPRIVLDQHLPFVSVFLLMLAWFALTLGKIYFFRVAPSMVGG